jgi:hypothetical protein
MQPSVRTKDSMVGEALRTTLPTAGLGGLPPMASRMRSTCSSVMGARPSFETTAGGGAGGAGGGGGAKSVQPATSAKGTVQARAVLGGPNFMAQSP